MEFDKMKTKELVEIYEKIEAFMSFLEKEKQEIEKE